MIGWRRHIQLGASLELAGDIQAAVSEYELAAEADPHDEETKSLLCRALLRLLEHSTGVLVPLHERRDYFAKAKSHCAAAVQARPENSGE